MTMTDPVSDGQLDGAGNEKKKLDLNDSTAVDLDLDESKAQLINANGGAGEHVDDYKTKIVDPGSSDDVSFNGLGKDEVMKYANDPFWVRLRWVLFILFWVGWLVMLVTAIAIIVLAPRCPPRPDQKWYHTEAVYQVYPKSFKDTNDDGVGDFDGVKEKEDYIFDDLGATAIWLNAIYKMDETGSARGVVDHKDIDPAFGTTLAKFKSWMKKKRKDGKKVILDLIPNQTSKNHTWFVSSVDEEEKYKDYYVWSDSKPSGDWKTKDGDDAWTKDDKRGEWYYSSIGPDYPDLNLRNEDVIEEIKSIMKFWLDAGAAGFHVNDLEYLVENSDTSAADGDDRIQTRNFNGTLDLLEMMRDVVDDYNKPGRERVLIGTTYHASLDHLKAYWGPDDHERLHIVIPVFDELKDPLNATAVKGMIEERLTDEEEQWLGLQLGNQFTSRISSRLSGSQTALMVAQALTYLLPGTPFNYYGDEYGQLNGPAGDNQYLTPMQWNAMKYAGFSKVEPWTQLAPKYQMYNAQAGLAHLSDMTPLEAVQELIKLRSSESLQFGKTQVCAPSEDLLLITRKAERFPFFLIALNMGSGNVQVRPGDHECIDSKDTATVVFHSREEQVGEMLDLEDYALTLEPNDVVVLEFTADD